MKHARTLVPVALVLVAAVTATGAGKEEPAFMRSLFLPELVMEHQRDIDLSREQRREITAAIQELQKDAVDIRWEMLDAMTELDDLLRAPHIDADAAMTRVQKVLELEARLKVRHLGLLIRIKNGLSPEQQRRLRAIRDGETAED